MKKIVIALFVGMLAFTSCTDRWSFSQAIVGARRTSEYMSVLRGKKVALYTDHTAVLPGGRTTLDLLLAKGVDVQFVLTADRNFKVPEGVGVVNLRGADVSAVLTDTIPDIDVVVVDFQDIGVRTYSPAVTMMRIMVAAARYEKDFVVLDRPNPNGMYVDGPVLRMKYKSLAGVLPVPMVHGLTIGEMALMTNEEEWLQRLSPSLDVEHAKVKNLTVVPCRGYKHSKHYKLPVPTSSNLPNMRAVYLYPSLCLLEGTPVSLGRGTDIPYQVYGSPEFKDSHSFSFTPESNPGARSLLFDGVECFGKDLSGIPYGQIVDKGFNMEYVIDVYRSLKNTDGFFSTVFTLKAGDDYVERMIKRGYDIEEIRMSWSSDVALFKEERSKYLLYKE